MVNAGNGLGSDSAHDCPTTPVSRRLEQLRYTTAFMTRGQCTCKASFVNENLACADRRVRRDAHWLDVGATVTEARARAMLAAAALGRISDAIP